MLNEQQFHSQPVKNTLVIRRFGSLSSVHQFSSRMPTVTRTLSTAPLKDVYQKEFLQMLDAHPGPKVIYWEREVISPVNLIIGHSLLKEHGVNYSFVIEPSQTAPPPPDVNTIFFILRSDLKVLDIVVKYLKIEFSRPQQSSGSTKKEYCIIAIPKCSIVCKSFLRESLVMERLTAVYNLPLILLPLDSDLLSMEDPNCFSDFSLRNKENGLFNFAKGLMKFQSVYGLFPRIRSKGPKAKRIAEMLAQMRQEAMATANLDTPAGHDGTAVQPLDSPGQIDLLIIIDRSVDALTPCLSQLTYEGLINEVWPVMYGNAKLPQAGNKDGPKRVVFNSADLLFSEIRDQNFADIGAILGKRAKELSNVMNEAKSSTKLTTLRQVVNQLPELRQSYASASLHMTIAECVQDYATTENSIASYRTQQDFLNSREVDKIHPFVEQRILQMAPIEEILQLLCVQSFCSGGLKQRLLEFYMREIIQMYGPEHMMTLNNLRKLGLLEESSRLALTSRPTGSPTSVFSSDTSAAVRHTIASVSLAYASTLRRSLRLQVTNETPQQQHSMGAREEQNLDAVFAHIFGGSVPISVRLVQAMTLGWPTRPLISTPAGGGGALLSSAASTALHAGRRLVSHVQAVSSSGGNYVTNLIPAVEVDEVQGYEETGNSPNGSGLIKRLTPSAGAEHSKTVVIAFVGGVTHSELAALRKVAACDEGQVDFVFATTGLLTWRKFIKSLSDTIPVNQIEG
ncbi:Vacuolar protein sorting-associated protein 33A [Taenia crassiceps]|uniref:Vacuolar protein sorting-associated protein 33A n=1 Tax=Taenia crassiceps TaxID=6207 RepID=A0ABR4QRW6_9CEST